MESGTFSFTLIRKVNKNVYLYDCISASKSLHKESKGVHTCHSNQLFNVVSLNF